VRLLDEVLRLILTTCQLILSRANLNKDRDIQYHLAGALDRLGRTAGVRVMLETLLRSDMTFSDRARGGKVCSSG
jgi:hypothetical protein